MKDSYTHVAMVLDRSGSMMGVRSDIVGGFNQFIEEQKKAPGECTVTLVQFDSQEPYEVLRDFTSILDTPPLGDEYQPRGMTPLFDAVGRCIANTGERLAALPEEERPAKVVVVILTDGLENASREYTSAQVAKMTKEQTEKYGWQFVYLGANQDAIEAGGDIGVTVSTSADYSSQKTSSVLRAASANLASYRSGAKADMSWSAEQRKAMV